MRNRAKTGGSLLFFMKEGITNIFVNGFMSFAAISIIGICILIVGTCGLVTLNINQEIDAIKNESQIMIFIDNESEDAYLDIYKELDAIEDISNIIFVTKEEALESYKESLGENSFALEGLENDNPLRDGYTIYLGSLDNIDQVTEQLWKIDGVANVSSENDTFKALNNIQKAFNIISLVLIVSLGGIAIFIISNTVKLAMFNRRGEISIMKMIGATDAFIRRPFIIEGMILGVLGSGLAFLAQWLVYNEFAFVINEYIGFVSVIEFISIRDYVLGVFLAIGTIIGVLGSTLTIRKFMDV